MKASDIAYNVLVYLRPKMRGKWLSSLWDRLWRAGLRKFSGPVKTRIHGRDVIVNYGYTYSVNARRYVHLNAPLVELAYQTWKAKGHKLTFVDVGAAVGDTVLLLYSNLPNAIGGFVCIDGDAEFFGYLRHNLSHLPEGRLILCMLSADESAVPALVRTHAGTASAQGATEADATTLSLAVHEDVDVLKIDVDGFDGRILVGACSLLERCKPGVIFEWHPILYRQTGNDWIEPFNVLRSAGYSTLLFFTKYGDFSHFMFQHDESALQELAAFCLSDAPADWHYDVIALHQDSAVDFRALARLEYSKTRPSRF